MTVHFHFIFKRDNNRCVYCGRDLLVDFETFMITEEDHLVPLSKGGEDIPDNIVTSCSVCNRLKGNFIPEIEFTEKNRIKYIADIRKYIMNRRALRMADYISWTHPS